MTNAIEKTRKQNRPFWARGVETEGRLATGEDVRFALQQAGVAPLDSVTLDEEQFHDAFFKHALYIGVQAKASRADFQRWLKKVEKSTAYLLSLFDLESKLGGEVPPEISRFLGDLWPDDHPQAKHIGLYIALWHADRMQPRNGDPVTMDMDIASDAALHGIMCLHEAAKALQEARREVPGESGAPPKFSDGYLVERLATLFEQLTGLEATYTQPDDAATGQPSGKYPTFFKALSTRVLERVESGQVTIVLAGWNGKGWAEQLRLLRDRPHAVAGHLRRWRRRKRAQVEKPGSAGP